MHASDGPQSPLSWFHTERKGFNDLKVAPFNLFVQGMADTSADREPRATEFAKQASALPPREKASDIIDARS